MKDCLVSLKNWGADPELAIERVDGDREFYKKMLENLAGNGDMERLETLLQNKNYPDALRFAHSLKGASFNLSLLPLAQAFASMVECLRPGSGGPPDTDDLDKVWTELDRVWGQFVLISALPLGNV